MPSKVTIEYDERGFYHIDHFINDDDETPNSFITTKKGETIFNALKIAIKQYQPKIIYLYEACEYCKGSTVISDDDEGKEIECDECFDGVTPREIVYSNSISKRLCAQRGIEPSATCLEKAVFSLYPKLLADQVYLEPEFEDIIQKNNWDLRES